MPEGCPVCCDGATSYILVHKQTLIQFNSVLIETRLTADEQLQQFFQLYQCLKTVLTTNKPKKALSLIHNFTSCLDEFKKYVQTYTKEHKPLSSKSESRCTRSRSKKHNSDLLIPSPSLSLHSKDSCNNIDDGVSDSDTVKEEELSSASLPSRNDETSNEIDSHKVDRKTENSLSRSFDEKELKNDENCEEMDQTNVKSEDRKMTGVKRKTKEAKETPGGQTVMDGLSKNVMSTIKMTDLKENENNEKTAKLMSSVKNKVKKKKVTSDGSADINNKIVEKASYTKTLGKYKCSLCSYSTTRKYDINSHCKKHKHRSYTCKDCQMVFETRQGLQRHLNLNHKQRAFAFTCPVCSKVFGYKSELEEHMLEHPGSWLHHCSKCKKGFSKQEYLTQHVKRCGRQRFIENNEYGKQGKIFFCKLCNYKTEWSTSIKRHRFTHTIVGKPTCQVCSKSYCCEGDLRDHMNVAHANAKFLCYQCGKEFSCRSSLLRHTQVTHELKYKYKCDICSQQFTDKRKMADHMDKHTGARNHICHICGMAYRYRPRLAVHLRRHQNPEPLVCEYCKKSFKNSDTLRVHIMGKHLDRKYRCPFCGKDFIWHKSMSHHKKRCRSRPRELTSDEVEVDVAQSHVDRTDNDDEILDEQMATDMVIQAAAEAVKAETPQPPQPQPQPPPNSNHWKVYRIPAYASSSNQEITVSGLPISNLQTIPMSHLSASSSSVSNFVNLSDVSASSLTTLSLPGLPSIPVATFTNLSMIPASNCQTSTAPSSMPSVTSMSGLPVSSVSSETITTLSNVPVSSLTAIPFHVSNLPASTMSNVQVSSMSNVSMSNMSSVPVSNVPAVSSMNSVHMNVPTSALHSVVTQGLSSEWKVQSSHIPVYVKDY